VRWLERPLLHFLAIGGALHALEVAGFGAGEGARAAAVPPVSLSPERIEALRRDWLARAGRPPDPEELEALVESALDDEVLLREARAQGLHLVDSVVRQRLVQNMRFLEGEAGRDDEALFREALELGMDETDVVVRRRLVGMLELAVLASVRSAPPAEEELRRYLERHASEYAWPERVRLSHVYLSRDARGPRLEAEAAALLERLVATGATPESAAALGDPFLLPRDLPLRGEAELARSLGPDFAREAIRLAPGAWAGPIPSSYGLHLVFVHERREARPAELSEVRERVASALLEERGSKALRELVGRLRARYGVPRGSGRE
jgi:hypothetical protein